MNIRAYRVSFYCLLFLAVLVRIWVAWHFHSRAWVDELWVVLQPAFNFFHGKWDLVFQTTADHVTPNLKVGVLNIDWIHGIRSALTPTLVAFNLKIFDLFGIKSGFYAHFLLRLTMSLSILFSLKFLIECLSKKIGLNRAPFFALFIAAFIPELIHYSTLFDLSVIGFPFLALGLGFFIRSERFQFRQKRDFFLMSFFVCIAALIRYQYIVFPVTLFVFFLTKKQWKQSVYLALVGGLLLVVDSATTSYLSGRFMVPMWSYFYFNIFQGVAASYGVTPSYFGLELLLRFITPGVFVIFILFLPKMVKDFGVLVLASLAFLGIHCLVGHKEYRFFYGAAQLFPVFLGLSLQKWIQASVKTKYLNAVFLLIIGASLLARIPKVNWADYEIPSKLEEVAGSFPDAKGVLSYGWGGIYAGGHFNIYKNISYYFLLGKTDFKTKRLNPSDFNYLIIPSSEPDSTCSELIEKRGGGQLFRCKSQEIQKYFE